MPKYRVYGVVTGTKYLGVFEADTQEEAEQMALESNENHVSICHQCAGSFDLDDTSCGSANAERDEQPRPHESATEHEEESVNQFGCRPSEDVCLQHCEPLVFRSGCTEGLKQKLKSGKTRTCYTMHACSLCELSIGLGAKYLESGKHRAHVDCV